MDETIMISLVGEQPIPNLLAILNNQSKRSVFVCTEFTKKISQRLCSVLKDYRILVEDKPIIVEPYNMVDVETKIKDYIRKKGWSPDKILFSLTGGTKPMALTA